MPTITRATGPARKPNRRRDAIPPVAQLDAYRRSRVFAAAWHAETARPRHAAPLRVSSR